MSFKLCVIGNCQARPLETILKAMCPSITCMGTIIVHLAKSGNAGTDIALMHEADIILAQSVQENYPVAHLRTATLRASFGSKVIVWPNLFFSGQCPGLVYVSKATGERVRGPLLDYQRQDIVESFRYGESTEDCIDRTRSGEGHDYLHWAEQSLADLEMREASIDIRIADIIATEWQRRRLFYSFNHPSSWLMIQLCQRILAFLSMKPELVLTPSITGEPLDIIVPPVLPVEAAALGLKFETTEASRGVEVSATNGKLTIGPRRIYSLEDLVSATYQSLLMQTNAADLLRYTPNTVSSRAQTAVSGGEKILLGAA